MEQQGNQQAGAEPREQGSLFVQFGRGDEVRGEPLTRQQIVDAQTEEDGTQDDADEVNNLCARA